jgi:hypothetical protein
MISNSPLNLRTSLLCALCFVASLICGHAGDLGAASTNLNEAIRQIRMGTLTIETVPGAEVRVEQVRHEFWFGAALASQMFSGRPDTEDAARYKRVFLENFSSTKTA